MILRTVGVMTVVLAGIASAETRVSAKLVSDVSAVARGDSFRMGVLFTIPERSHIYWHNQGDSGLPTDVELTLPEGFRVEDLEWPNPEAFWDEILDETSFGYESEVLLFATVWAPYTITPGESVAISANVEWLICLEDGQCIPEEASLELALPVAEDTAASAHTELFESYAARTPGSISETGVHGKVAVTGQPEPTVTVSAKEPWLIHLAAPEVPSFYPDRGGAWSMSDDNEGFEDAAEVTFVPAGAVEGYTSGAVTLPVIHADTGETRTAYIRFGARPDE